MSSIAQFSSDPNFNGIAYLTERDLLTASFENNALFLDEGSGSLFYYDSAGLNIGFGYNITANLGSARATLQEVGLVFSNEQWTAIESAASISSSQYKNATPSQLTA